MYDITKSLRMDKTKIFMYVTTIISVICFNFNKILDYIISSVSKNMYDESVLTYGPYIKSNPIVIELAMIDEHIYTNKTQLLLNWKWNFDILGFTTSDILILKHDAIQMVIQYRKKYDQCKSQLYVMSIDLKKNTVTQNGKTTDILFEEICLFK